MGLHGLLQEWLYLYLYLLLEERNHMGDLNVDVMILLKWSLKEYGVSVDRDLRRVLMKMVMNHRFP
jgi:hypothetical protein